MRGKLKKKYTCEEGGGTRSRISVWHLLMNLKNKYLFKKLLKWANKNCKCFNIYKNVKNINENKEKHLGISLFYTCVPTIFMLYSSWHIDCDKLKLVIMGHFFPFYPPPKSPKKQHFEKMKQIAGDIIILHKCTKIHNHMKYSSWDTE